jgi:inosine-uridine nucleoside N-ribohydrolase
MKKKVIVDCDNTLGLGGWELDDGLALLYILGVPELELVGITTTFGNAKINKVILYTKKLLKSIGREDIQLVKGASKRGEPPTEAASFLVNTVASNPREITLLALGPLGNLRCAAQIDENFFHNIKDIVLMGGITKYPFKIRNAIFPEINLSYDLGAALRVFHAECPITIINAHICKQVPFTKAHLERVSFWPQWLKSLILSLFATYKKYIGIDCICIWDVLVPLFLTNPELFDDHHVKIAASSVKDINNGLLVPNKDEKGVLINMPSNILDRGRFMDRVIESWFDFHNTVMKENNGYLEF